MPLALNAYPYKEHGRFSYCSRPNCSLTPGRRKLAFGLIAAMTLLVASGFGLLGYWLVLPFAGLEVGVLAWAFETVGKRSDDYESVSIDGDEILVERRQGQNVERRSFNCHWVRLVKETRRGGRVELALRSHGRDTKLGLFLTDEGRMELAEELQTWLKPGQ